LKIETVDISEIVTTLKTSFNNKRGRPKGSKNKKRDLSLVTKKKNKRGRPRKELLEPDEDGIIYFPKEVGDDTYFCYAFHEQVDMELCRTRLSEKGINEYSYRRDEKRTCLQCKNWLKIKEEKENIINKE
jgi:hypothetical protein